MIKNLPLGRHQPSTHLDIPRYSGFQKLTVKQKLQEKQKLETETVGKQKLETETVGKQKLETEQRLQ